MRSRVVVPEDTRLLLSNGDWLLVKKRLNAGENKAKLKRGRGADGRPDAIEAGTATILAYLLDWSVKGPDGKVLLIRDQSPTVVEEAVNAVDPHSYTEILRAIEAHEDAMEAERAAEKNAQDGEMTSSKTSPSVSEPVGA